MKIKYAAAGAVLALASVGVAASPASAAPPANDDIASAQDLGSALEGNVSGTNVDATPEVGEGALGCSSGDIETAWFTWTAPSNGVFQFFDTNGSALDTRIGVFDADPITGGGATVACDDDSGVDLASRVAFGATLGTTYFIQVDGFGSSNAAFELSWAPAGPLVFVATADNNLVSFDSRDALSTDGTVTPLSNTAITGLPAGHIVEGLDFRPSTQELYLFTTDGANNGWLWTIDTETAAVSPVNGGAITGVPAGSFGAGAYAFDINPVVDGYDGNAIRIIGNDGERYAVNQITAFAIQDANLAFDPADVNAGQTPIIASLAYTNSFPGAGSTNIYGIDYRTATTTANSVRLDFGSTGAVHTRIANIGGPAQFQYDNNNTSLDIDAKNKIGIFAETEGTGSGLHGFDPATGAVTDQRGFFDEGRIRALAIAPAGLISFDPAAVSVDEAAGSVDVTLNRTQGTYGTVSVLVSTAAVTATDGADYTGTSEVVTFADGETTKVVTLPILDDVIFDDGETFTVGLSLPTGGARASSTPATVTIDDNETSSIEFAFLTYKVNERYAPNGRATITVTRTGDTSTATSVQYATSNGTALAAKDYVAASGTLQFAPGQTSKTFDVRILRDTSTEGTESVILTLSNVPAGTALGTPNPATLNIDDQT